VRFYLTHLLRKPRQIEYKVVEMDTIENVR
jgi:hypothetical protein